MKVKVEEWEVLGEDMEGDPHIACSLLKLWLREMAEPLFPTDFTPEVRKKQKQGSNYNREIPGSSPDIFTILFMTRLDLKN